MLETYNGLLNLEGNKETLLCSTSHHLYMPVQELYYDTAMRSEPFGGCIEKRTMIGIAVLFADLMCDFIITIMATV